MRSSCHVTLLLSSRATTTQSPLKGSLGSWYRCKENKRHTSTMKHQYIAKRGCKAGSSTGPKGRQPKMFPSEQKPYITHPHFSQPHHRGRFL